MVLDAAEARFDDLARGHKHPIIFSAELIPANSNVGAALLEPRTLELTRLYLDRLVLSRPDRSDENELVLRQFDLA